MTISQVGRSPAMSSSLLPSDDIEISMLQLANSISRVWLTEPGGGDGALLSLEWLPSNCEAKPFLVQAIPQHII